MYPDVPRTVRLGTREDEDRPLIPCEYSHAMGNSNGNVHLYWDYFWSDDHPRMQGGFIWDMIDQGLRKVDGPTQRSFFAYGGDFGDTPNDLQFCINGLFSPDREPHPAVNELKYLQQPVAFKVPSSNNSDTIHLNVNGPPTIALNVVNRYSFRDLSNLTWTWNVTSDCALEPVGSGSFEVTNATLDEVLKLPLKQVVAKVTSEARKVDHTTKFYLNLCGSLKDASSWAKKGHELVSQQFRLQFDGLETREKPKSTGDKVVQATSLQVSESNSSIIVLSVGKDIPLITIDKASGAIKSFSTLGGKGILASPTEVDVAGIVPNYTRAATDNDAGGAEVYLGFVLPDPLLMPVVNAYNFILGSQSLSYVCQWKLHGLDPASPPKTVCNKIVASECDDRVEIQAECTTVRQDPERTSLFHTNSKYIVFSDGRVQVAHHVIPCRSIRSIPSLPRVGVSMALDSSLFNISYFGRGPHENYPDRKSGAQLGVWSTTAKENDFEYIVPSENGSKSDCDWVAFRDESGYGVCVVPEPAGINFNASLYSQEEFHLAKHTYDLPARQNGTSPIHFNIDAKLMGVGGDTSWYPVVYDRYKVLADREYNYR